MADRVYPPVIATARAVFATLGLRFLESGTENVPTSGGAVLAANHVSYLDFIFAGLAALPSHRLVRFMAKECHKDDNKDTLEEAAPHRSPSTITSSPMRRSVTRRNVSASAKRFGLRPPITALASCPPMRSGARYSTT